MPFDADIAMIQAYLDAHDGDIVQATVDWRALKAEADAQIDREIEAAKQWQPKVAVEPLAPGERDELNQLLAGRLTKRSTVGAVKLRRDDAAKGPAYAAAAIEGEADAIAHAPVGLRNITLNAAAWSLARPELDGIVTASDIEDALVPAAVDAGLTEQEARSVVRSALRKRSRK